MLRDVTEMPPSSAPPPCPCCPVVKTEETEYNITEPPFIINTSDFTIHVKEVFILGLIFLLLIYSLVIFFNRWSKNYRDITQTPYYSTQEEEQCSGGKMNPKIIKGFLADNFFLCKRSLLLIMCIFQCSPLFTGRKMTSVLGIAECPGLSG